MDKSVFYHYTNHTAFDSILNSKVLRLSSVKKVARMENNELYIKPYYFSVVSKLKQDFPEDPFIQMLPLKFDSVINHEGKICNFLSLVYEGGTYIDGSVVFPANTLVEDDFTCFIFCLSTDPDNRYLKTYYSNGSNCSLSIDIMRFIDSIKQSIVDFSQKKFDEDNKSKVIREILGNGLRINVSNKRSIGLGKDLLEYKKVIYSKDEKESQIRKLIMFYKDKMVKRKELGNFERYTRLLMYELSLLSLYFKEEGFSLEKEVRVIVLCPEMILDRLKSINCAIGESISIPIDGDSIMANNMNENNAVNNR